MYLIFENQAIIVFKLDTDNAKRSKNIGKINN